MMLALVKCQQICQIDKIVEYSDPECKNEYDFGKTPEFLQTQIDRLNEIIGNGTRCQQFNPGENAKLMLTCLSSEALKVETVNFKGEDKECKYPYPEYADFPSYVANNGECVRTSRFSYVRYFISSTNGKFEQTTNSWVVAEHDK